MAPDATLPAGREASRDTPARLERPEIEAETRELAQRLARAGVRLKQALAEKERLSRTLTAVIETLDAGVILLGEAGKPLAHNAAARRLGLVVREGGGRGEGWVLSAALEAAGRDAREGAPIRPEGAPGRTWLIRRSSVDDAHFGPCHVLMVQDITETLELQEAAQRSSRLEGMGRMLAEVGHQIRNPLGGLELFAAMLIDDLEEQPAQREIAQEMLAGVRQLSATVTNLLARVRDRRARREPVDLAALLDECLDAMGPIALARGVALEGRGRALPGRPPLDGEGLRQAVLNLLDNAIEASGRDGRVALDAWIEGRTLTLAVDDSGPGVDEGIRDKLFEPFFTTRAEGTGLGLSVVERVAHAHGGSARVAPSRLGGARFEITCDLEPPPTPTVRDGAPDEESPR